jgi:hypothetical protein
MDVSIEKTKVCQEATKVCLGKTEATIRAGQKPKLGLSRKKTKVNISEANQENIEAAADRYNVTPCAKASHVLVALQRRASDVQGTPKGSAFEMRRRTGPEFSNVMRDRVMERQLHLGTERTVNEAIRQTLELES